jgi:hypothetical protein
VLVEQQSEQHAYAWNGYFVLALVQHWRLWEEGFMAISNTCWRHLLALPADQPALAGNTDCSADRSLLRNLHVKTARHAPDATARHPHTERLQRNSK